MLLFASFAITQIIIELELLGEYGFFTQMFVISLLVAINILWMIYSTRLKKEMVDSPPKGFENATSDPLEEYTDDMPFLKHKKYRILFACYASHIASSVMIGVFASIAVDLEKIGMIFQLYLFFGWLITVPIFWIFFSKRME